MRKMTWILGLFVGGLCLAELASGQQGGFGGFGGGGFGKAADPVTLINNASVKKELDITDEQSAAVPAAVMKALGGVLNEKQFKRFKQIHVQQQGAQAFGDTGVQKELKLTAAQKENVKTILDDNKKELQELGVGAFGKGGGKGGFGKGNAENLEKITNLNKETLDKLNGMLTPDQKTTWKAITGDKFELVGGFGGGGFGGKGGKKKKDQ